MPTTVTREAIQAKVVDALAELGPERDQIVPEATFESLDIDSLDLVELAQIVEEEFGVVISGEDAQKLKTVRGAVDLIESRAA